MDKIIDNRYKLIEVIGEGGMNEVYKAEDLETKELVAVKILRPEFRKDEDVVKKFHVEAEAVQKLNNPNIVKVLNVGNEGDVHYIVMELLTSRTLKDYITESDVYFRNDEIIDLALQILRAIKEAHDNGIIHRDIKPQNILMTEGGSLKVSDFGIASVKKTGTITSGKEAIGSVHYASPEQSRGCILDKRTDIYSFGILLYEIATGRVPFEGDTAIAIAIKHSKGAIVKPCYINMSLNPSIQKIIMRCIARTPALRFENVDEIINVLDVLKGAPDDEIEGELAKTLEIPNETINMEGFKELIDEVDMELEVDERDNLDVKINEQVEEKPAVLPIILTALGGVVVAALLLTFTYVHFFGNNTAVPAKKIVESKPTNMIDIKGLTITEATEKLKETSVTINKTGEEFDVNYEKGQIISYTPDKGALLKSGSVISVVVSKGYETVVVPELSAKNVIAANTLAHNANLEVKIHNEYSKVKPDNVIRQEPAAGQTVKKGTVVNLFVSIGENANIQIMPDLKGVKKDDALKTIASKKLKVGLISTEYDKKIENGCIISQSVAAGTDVTEGSMINLVISIGKDKGDELSFPEENPDIKGVDNKKTADAKKNETPKVDETKKDSTTKPAEKKDNKPNSSETPANPNPADTSKPTETDIKPDENPTGSTREATNTSSETECRTFFVPFTIDGNDHSVRVVKVIDGKEVEVYNKVISKDKSNAKVTISGSGKVRLKFYVDGKVEQESVEDF